MDYYFEAVAFEYFREEHTRIKTVKSRSLFLKLQLYMMQDTRNGLFSNCK